MTSAFASGTSPTVQFDPGVYNLTCATFNATSSISLRGAGLGKTILRFPASCPFTSDIFTWNSKSNVTVSDITIDLNTPTSAPATYNALGFLSFTGDTDQLLVTNSAIINGTAPIIMVGFAATAGYSYRNVKISSNYISLTSASTKQNQCIASSTLDGAGQIPSSEISFNTCVNSAIQSDGTYSRVIGNDVSGFEFGTGIYMAHNTTTGVFPTSNNCIISNNVLHDSPSTFDVNDTPPGGIENNCYAALIVGNLAYNLGGYGFLNYGSNSTYVGNIARNNGKSGSGSVMGSLTESGFALNQNVDPNIHHDLYDSRNLTFVGNVAFDDNAGSQKFGYNEGLGATYGAILTGNNFRGAQQGLNVQRGISNNTTSPDGFISTIGSSAAPSTDLTWSNLDTSSYKRWILSCHDVTPHIAGPIGIEIATGSPAVWQTSANYFSNQIESASGAATNVVAGLFSYLGMGTSSWDFSGVLRGSFTVEVGDLSIALWQKAFRWSGTYRNSPVGNYTPFSGMGAWVGSNDAITALRVRSGGNPFTGVCTLQGLIT